jgi:hypothetical protein
MRLEVAASVVTLICAGACKLALSTDGLSGTLEEVDASGDAEHVTGTDGPQDKDAHADMHDAGEQCMGPCPSAPPLPASCAAPVAGADNTSCT